MKLFEYEAKDILGKYGVARPSGEVAKTVEDAVGIATRLGKPVAVKSQVLVAGRGKSGGILFADDPAAAGEAASKLLGSQIKGITVDNLLIEEKVQIAEQLYASIAIDRSSRQYVALLSTSGGVDIEEVARKNPEKILRHWIDPDKGFDEAAAAQVVGGFSDLSREDRGHFASIASTLFKVAGEYDAELVELNPLVKTATGRFVAADARMIIDDNAIFRHAEFEGRSAERAEDTERETEARKQGLAYVDLDGDIGIIGNGAGLVMATMDLVNVFGGKAANFLDIGGGARAEVIKNGLLLVLSKPEVKAVLINILGGITRCDVVAEGVMQGLEACKVKKPIAVRMMGTNEEEGARMLAEAGIKVYPDMETAAEQLLSSISR